MLKQLKELTNALYVIKEYCEIQENCQICKLSQEGECTINKYYPYEWIVETNLKIFR